MFHFRKFDTFTNFLYDEWIHLVIYIIVTSGCIIKVIACIGVIYLSIIICCVARS